MITSQETGNILKALISAAPEISSIAKSKQAYGYKYATLDSLIDMLRGVLPKHGLWFIQMPTRVGEKSTLTTRVFHESGEWLEDCIEMTDTELQGKANDTQKVGASITYFRRYALSSIFGVASDEDVDGNLNSKRTVDQRQPQPQQPKIEQPKPKEQKLNPMEYVTSDFNSRITSGETEDSIIADYKSVLESQGLVVTENKLDKFNGEQIRQLATAIYLKNKRKAS